MADDPALAEREAELSAETPDEDTPPFREQWVSEELTSMFEIAVGSLDRDHKMDIVANSFSFSGAAITVFERRGVEYAPVFTDLAVEEPNCVALAVGDTDGDRAMEILCGVTSTNRIRLLESTGDDTYVEQATNIDEENEDNQQIEQLRVADLDQDGREEIIISMDNDGGEGFIFVYEHDGAADGHNFVKLFSHEVSIVQFHFTVGDSDNDGFQEIIFGAAGSRIHRIENAGDDSFEVKTVQVSPLGLHSDAEVADVDLDGANELVFTGSGPGGGGIFIVESTADDQYETAYTEFGMGGSALVADARVGRGSPYPLLAIGSHGGSSRMGRIWFWRFTGETYERLDHLAIEGSGDIRNMTFANLDDDFRPDLVYTLNDAPSTIHVLEQRN